MFDANFQRSLPQRLPRLARDYGIIPMARGRAGVTVLEAMGLDAQSPLTTTPNAGIPSWMANWIDPDVLKILFAPNKGAAILGGERKVGDWATVTSTFPIAEHTGDVSSYGDYSEDGIAGANFTFPQRESYHYQSIAQFGEREIDMVALAKINLVAEKKEATTTVLNKFGNQTYFYGVAGLQNYGLLNDPALPALLTPGLKVAGGRQWITNGVVTATANEIYLDIQTAYLQLVAQTDTLVELTSESKLVLAMHSESQVALTALTVYNVSVFDQLKKNFPNIRFETAVQYSTAAGYMFQLFAEEVEGQVSGWPAFTEKLRAHTIVRHLSSWRQKVSQGTWGAILRQPFAFTGMIGI